MCVCRKRRALYRVNACVELSCGFLFKYLQRKEKESKRRGDEEPSKEEEELEQREEVIGTVTVSGTFTHLNLLYIEKRPV